MYLKTQTLGRLPTPTTAQLSNLPEGKAGTVATLRIMRDLARAAIRDPQQKIRLAALNIIGQLPARQWSSEVAALHRFVRDDIRYVRDPVGVESVATPDKTLEIGQGDCDDKSVLLAALLESVGHPARFRAIGLNGGPFSHVLVQTKIGPQWVNAETIIPVELGWTPKGVTSNYILGV
ncbi:MAG: transglutaminase family protein [Hyphomonadaceae bacterium]